jgi:toxic protein SymE
MSKKGNKGTRKLKVCRKYFSRQTGYVIYPEIRLSGKWLEDCGFICNEPVAVYYSHRKILIRKEKGR